MKRLAMKHDRVYLFSLVLVLFIAMESAAADWPNWRGPDRNGKVSADGFNPAFAKDGAKVKWSVDIGVGFTGVTVVGNRVYTAGWKDGNTWFYCFNKRTGDGLWSHTFPTKKYDNLNVGGPSGTPAVDGDRVYHQARDGQTFCYHATTGKVIWKKDLAKAYNVKVPTWGFSGSPVVIGDVVYLDMGKIIALNKATGEEIWATKDFGPAYSTPAPFEFKGKDYLAVFPKSGLYVLERASGKQVAHQPWKTNYGVHAATPVVVGDTILVSSEYNNGCALLKFNGSGLEILWENKNLRQKMGTSVYHDGAFYGFDSTKLTCVDAKTGEEKWDQRGLGHGTIIMAGDTLIVLSDSGELLTAKASPDGFKPISSAKLIDGDKTVWTAPTLANGMLYVRGSKGKLVCIDASE